jgi:hypothetical protein
MTRDLITLFLLDPAADEEPEIVQPALTAAPRDHALLAWEALMLRAMCGDLDACELQDMGVAL